MKTLNLFTAIIAVVLTGSLMAQSTGSIKGTVVDEKNAAMLFVPVALLDDSTIIASTTTDEKGDFTIKDIVPGRYDLKVSYTGYDIMILKDIEVSPVKIRYVNIKMKMAANILDPVVIVDKAKEPILDPGYESITKIDINQIKTGASGKSDVIAIAVINTPAVIATPDGKDIYMRGSRRGSSGYIVDGNRMMGPPQVAGLSISGMEVLTGGMPAEYGDCTGGLVIITTKDYQWEMRRKQMAKTDREEREEKEKNPKKKKWYFTIH